MVNVNTGDNITMLGHWRVVLKQAEESAKAGRFDEALTLASRPDVADHRQAVQFRARMTQELTARAERRAAADDLNGAIEDLELAERHGMAPDILAAARLRLADRIGEELRVELDAGDPAQVIERIDRLARAAIGSPALRRVREAADAWRSALAEFQRGEFGRALEWMQRAERFLGESGQQALATARRDLEARQQSAQPKIEQLYHTLAERPNRWSEILSAAEAVLELIPEHPAARQARARAWQQIGAMNPAVTLPARARTGQLSTNHDHLVGSHTPRRTESPEMVFLDDPSTVARPAVDPAPGPRRFPMPTPESGLLGKFLLWADAIGGYLICLDNQVVLGRAGADSAADVPVLGDLSRRHAVLIRDGDGYVLKAEHSTFVNGRRVASVALRDGDVIRLGSTVELEFRQPSPVSSTARLKLLSRHRLPMAVDGVILMAQTCIVGPTRQAHILAPNLKQPVVLFQQGNQLWCRATGGIEVDGRPCGSRSALTPQSRVLGDGFSFSLEPLEPQLTRGLRRSEA